MFETNTKGKLKLDTIKDRIAAYMIGEMGEELTAEEHKIMARWQQIWTFLNNYYTPLQAVEAHIKLQENAGEPITRRTAYRDLRAATDIFGDASRINRKAQLILIHEFALKTFQLGVKQGNVTEMNKAISNLVKVAKETEDFMDHEVEAHTYVLQLQTASGKIKTINLDHMNQIPKSEYYEIIEAVEGEEFSSMEMRQLLSTNQEDAEKSQSE